MIWNRAFISQDYGRPIYKHKNFPVYITDEFDFFRCVEFNNFYGKTASVLFNGNLRDCFGRYSKLFPNQKLSYWADSPMTARAEIKKYGAGNNILTFWAYDDGTSTFPTLSDQDPLIIIDGRKSGVQELIDKVDNDIPLSEMEQKYMADLLAQEPDCLVFDSHAKKDYSPCIESYGQYFLPKAKVAMDMSYLESDEYLLRKQILEKSYRKIREVME